MDDATLQDGPRFHRYLPGIYQEQTQPETPLYALLDIFEGFVSRIEQGIEDAPSQFAPYSARPEFLDWLASWVALPLDDEWNAESQRARKSYLISHAAELYRYRGTATILKYMLRAFHGLDSEILEWTWPACMQIEVTSTVGINSTIMDQPELHRCFVVVLRLDEAQRAESTRFVDLTPINLTGHSEACVSTPVLKQGNAATASFIRKLEKIRFLVDSEKPAHTRCYVVIEEPMLTRTSVHLEAMTIEVYSTIGLCEIT